MLSADIKLCVIPLRRRTKRTTTHSFAVGRGSPALRLALVCDSAGDPAKLAVAIRAKGSVEVLIPAARFDPFALLELVERHTVHAGGGHSCRLSTPPRDVRYRKCRSVGEYSDLQISI